MLSYLNLDSVWSILAVIPGAIAVLLIVPVPNYHNVMVCIGEVINFYSNNRSYKWRGWCAVYESEREQRAITK